MNNSKNTLSSPKDLSLNDLFARCLALKPRLSPSTRLNQQTLWRTHVQDSLGLMPLSEIKKSDILLFYGSLAQKDGMKNSSIHRIHHLLHPCFELAVDDDLIKKNPCIGCLRDFPSDTPQKQALTPDEQQNFLRYVKETPRFSRYYPLFAFMLETALRRGEVFGLTYDDVNWKKKTVQIDHQLQYGSVNGKMAFYIAPPKTSAGVRTIPLTEFALSMLREQRERQKKDNRQTTVTVDGKSGFIFSTKNATPYIPSNINATLGAIVRSYNAGHKHALPHITAHILRHTACTRMAEAGIDLKVLQYLMGHSSISVTMNVYNHVSEERNRREIQKIDRRRRQIKENPLAISASLR